MCKDLSGKPDPVTDLIAPEETLETPELSVGERLREAREWHLTRFHYLD